MVRITEIILREGKLNLNSPKLTSNKLSYKNLNINLQN